MNKNIKYLLFGFLTLIVLCLAIFNFFQNNIYNYFISYNIEKNLYTQEFNKEEIVVFTIGTGSPMTAQKASSGIGIFVNEKFFIFDVGDGVVKKAENMNLPLAELDGIFLTHYHSDHFIDLPYLINRSWVLGRDHDLNVYGPTGLDEIMNSNTSFLKLENQYRVDHHGSEIMDIKYAHGKINEFAEKNNQIVYNKDKIKITAFKVNHSPVSPAVGYMIEYDGKKIVISGDTKINENVFKMAENADLLIHEVILNSLLKRTATILDQKLLTRNSHIITDIQDYHTPPKEIVKQANKANVKALVLTHLVPYPDNLIIKSLYKKEIKGFDGKVYLANDGDKFIIK